MSSAPQAADVLAGLEYSYPTIRNKRVYWQYSEREHVEAKTAVYVTDNRVTGQTQGGLDPSLPTTVLLSITEVSIPVSLEAVHQIGSPFGSILRIITFNKGSDYQALLEYATSEEANAARLGLDGKDVYEGCCHIRANFSNKNTLVVKQNDNRSWDYTLGQRGPGQSFAPMGAFAQPLYYGGFPGYEGAMVGGVPDPYAMDPYAYGPPGPPGAYPAWQPPYTPQFPPQYASPVPPTQAQPSQSSSHASSQIPPQASSEAPQVPPSEPDQVPPSEPEPAQTSTTE